MGKAYGAIRALDDVSLTLRAREVHCVAGENGAGKSTLIKILTGAIERDSGEYLVNGSPSPGTPSIARDAGVGVVYQELSLLPDLSVAENLLLGRLPARNWVTRPRELRRRAIEMLGPVALDDLDPDTLVRDVPLATQQLVEIAKVLGQRPKVVIFDEPTTALSAAATAALLEQIRRLRREDHAIMYVTHHLEEMFEIGDRVTVLRDGRLITSARMADFDHDTLITSMVGRKIESRYPIANRTVGETRLDVRGLLPVGGCEPIDLQVRAGEIVGIAGLPGSGRSELLRALFGADPVVQGEVAVDGNRVPMGRPRSAVKAGMGLLTEDRKSLGLLLELSIRENTSIASLDQFSRLGLVNRARNRARWRGCSVGRGCAPSTGNNRCPRCPGATSRRCCWPAGWRPTPR